MAYADFTKFFTESRAVLLLIAILAFGVGYFYKPEFIPFAVKSQTDKLIFGAMCAIVIFLIGLSILSSRDIVTRRRRYKALSIHERWML